MLKKRIIPKLLLKKSRSENGFYLVITKGFHEEKPVGDPISQARIYQAQNVDELLVLNIDSSSINSEVLECVHTLSLEIFMPITIGGGVSRLDDFELLLSKGADKVSINSAIFGDRSLIRNAAKKFGSQCVVVSIDYRKIGGRDIVFSNRGIRDTSISLDEWVKMCEDEGAGEILMTNIDRDGSQEGLDLKAIESICNSVSIPVIASGGCGLAKHFAAGLECGASAVAAGTFFSCRDQSPMQCRAHIKNAGIPIRMHI